MACDRPILAARGDGGQAIGEGIEGNYTPLFGEVPLPGLGVPEGDLTARVGNVDFGEGDGDAVAVGFEEGFFAGPVVEEEGHFCALPLVELMPLAGAEDTRSEKVNGNFGAEEFDVDADFAPVGDGEESPMLGMGDVEMPVAMIGEKGLAVWGVGDGEFGGGNTCAAGEDFAEMAAPDDESGSVAVEVKVTRSLAFGAIEMGF